MSTETSAGCPWKALHEKLAQRVLHDAAMPCHGLALETDGTCVVSFTSAWISMKSMCRNSSRTGFFCTP